MTGMSSSGSLIPRLIRRLGYRGMLLQMVDGEGIRAENILDITMSYLCTLPGP